ncbi:MAG TPA: ligase-associated DNA damage response exonuclease [Cryomorphaceae bacterium]|nr:DNA ligase-associated DEXH box helicase [Owenweeksia sp.]HBF20243.1 ligase-associated DNA damage response exonuclease [Cryomorphaceae bacterium]|tara:strand:- start:8062 stop:9069 length:1008 start_codon:yes stop_codon:yes gene_type:complete
MNLLVFNDRGIYCPVADVYIDPWKPVDKALITHAHADHARPGHAAYLCHKDTAPVMRYRLGDDIRVQTVEYGERIKQNGVIFSFYPAGHIPGSAQIRVEYKGEIWVVSGDYKLGEDGISAPFEPVRCHHFITESTFGLPVYTWDDQQQVFEEINAWWRQNQNEGRVSILAGYSLGKAQRILKGLNPSTGKIFTHGAVENTNEVLRKQGISLPDTILVTPEHKKGDFTGALVVCPPSAIGTAWMRKFGTVSTGFCSGWMRLRGARRRRAMDRGFILSDHADWPGLNQAVKETGAENIYVTHGYKDIYARWLRESMKLNGQPVDTLYEDQGESDSSD